MVQTGWIVDRDDPRAPPQEVWDAMSEKERATVVASLPNEVPLDLHPPEGDPHRIPKETARDSLNEYFRRTGRGIYLSSELATYYPNEARFCPDILAVLDVEQHPRNSWVVSQEGKGLDLVIEIHVSGDRRKDFELNVERYARLGIREYFIFDTPKNRLVGFSLKPGAKRYEPMLAQGGRFTSKVLDLELTVEGGMLRFYNGTAPLLFMDEIVSKLNTMVAELHKARDTAFALAEQEAKRAEGEAKRADDEAKRADDEAKRADDEAKRADALATENEELRAELERLRRERE